MKESEFLKPDYKFDHELPVRADTELTLSHPKLGKFKIQDFGDGKCFVNGVRVHESYTDAIKTIWAIFKANPTK